MARRSKVIAPLASLAAALMLFQNCGLSTPYLAAKGQAVPPSAPIIPLVDDLILPGNTNTEIAAGESGTAAGNGSSVVAAAAKSPVPSTAAVMLLANPRLLKDAVLERAWNESKTKFRLLARSAATDSSVIYNVQMEMSSFLQYAYENRKTRWLSELMDIYLEPAAALRETTSYVFYYPVLADGSAPARKSLALTAPHRMWLHSSGEESVLESSQFLYAITLLLSWIAEEHLSDPTSLQFLNVYAPVATNHLLRWILKKDSPHGIFQVTGWGCGSGTFSHREFVAKLAARAFAQTPKYCNAVTDVDLFLLAETLHLLAAHAADPSRIPLASADASSLAAYAHESMNLFKSRLTYGTVVDRAGATRTTAGFDLGSWDDYPDYAYAGDGGATFPGCLEVLDGTCVQAPTYRAPQKGSGVGWDVSHARRFTIFLFSLKTFGAEVISPAEVQDLQQGFSSQMAYRVFNGNFEAPAFTTYMDGTNGWYRVNYDGRKANSGEYSPWSPQTTEAAVLGGYFFWAAEDPEWERIAIAAEKTMTYSPSWPYHCVQAYASMPPRFFLNRGNAGADGSVCGR
jgi:hypothetical protein